MWFEIPQILSSSTDLKLLIFQNCEIWEGKFLSAGGILIKGKLNIGGKLMKCSDFQASIFFHHAYRKECMLVTKLLKQVAKKFSCKKVPLEAKYGSTHLAFPNYVL